MKKSLEISASLAAQLLLLILSAGHAFQKISIYHILRKEPPQEDMNCKMGFLGPRSLLLGYLTQYPDE